MTINGDLERLYRFYPAIRGWARSGVIYPWGSHESAALAFRDYAGLHCLPSILESHHVRDEADIRFVRSDRALAALEALAAAVEGGLVLKDGLLPEEDQ